jgi:hypothetical protein
MNPSVESVGDPEEERVLAVYSNPGEEFVAEHKFAEFDLGQFVDWFNPDGGDPSLGFSYVVLPKDVEFLSARLAEPFEFDFNRYCYFVEASRED